MQDNPYESPPDSMATGGQTLSRQIRVRPFDRLQDAQVLIGDQYWLFVGMCFVGMIINGIAQGLLLGPIACGFHLCCDDRASGNRTTFERLFEGFEHFLPSFLATLLIMLTMVLGVFLIVAMLFTGAFFAAIGAGGNGDVFGFTLAAGIIPTVLIIIFLSFACYIPFLFTFALIVDQGMSPLAAIQTSWVGARKNFWGLLGLALVLMR